MDAKELRIGNLIHVFRNPTDKGFSAMEVVCIDKENVELSDGFLVNHETGIQSIPLTEGWLLKFGFVKGINEYSGQECIFTNKINIYFDEDVASLYKYNDCRVYINHVHSLQNLYFALTGEELEYTV